VITSDCTNNRLDGRRIHLSENLVHLIPDMLAAGRLQISHRRFHVRMAQPLLHRAQIDTCPETPSSERCTKLVKPEVVFVEPRMFCNGLQAIEEVELWLAAGSRKH
jgi:hypothetical protein